MKFSLIIPTRGRSEELGRLFRSISRQTLQDFEVILSDQNDDDRLAPFVANSGLSERLLHLKSSGGASRGRNEGIERASGEILCFPDDDCTVPPQILQRVADFFATRAKVGVLTGRSFSDEAQAVSKFSTEAGEIKKATIHLQCIEFTIFVRRSSLGALRFDEQMGVGSVSPWHSDEGPDLILRLQNSGVEAYYDPQIALWHPQPITTYGPKDVDRAYRYACGNGYFYRKHSYSFWYFLYYISRTLAGCLIAFGQAKPAKARFYAARFQGMWRGWRAGSKKSAGRSLNLTSVQQSAVG